MKTQLVSEKLVCLNHVMWLSAYYLIFSVQKVQGISISSLDFIFYMLQLLHQQMLSSNITTSYNASNGKSNIIYHTRKTVY